MKLLKAAGDPAAPAADPPATLPGPRAGALGAAPQQTRVPTLSEIGYSEPATSPFKVCYRFEPMSLLDVKYVKVEQMDDSF